MNALTLSLALSSFVPTQQFVPAAVHSMQPNDFRDCDLDGDGDLDIVAIGDKILTWYRLETSGEYSAQAPIELGEGGDDLLVGDWTSDGSIDLLTWSNGSNAVRLHSRAPSGEWLAPTTVLAGALQFEEPVHGDFDGDGDMDCAWVSNAHVWALINNGPSSTPTAYQVSSSPTYYNHKLSAGDLNTDGAAELLLGDPSTGDLWSWSIDSSGGITASTLEAQSLGNITCIEWADWNADGFGDVLVGTSIGGQTGIFCTYGTPTGALGSPVLQFALGSFSNVQVGHFNLDGLPDLAYIEGAYLRVRGNPSGPTGQYTPGPCSRYRFSDHDNDGLSDLTVQVSGTSARVYGLINNGLSQYPVEAPVAACLGSVTGASSGDINQDGYPDLLITGTASGSRVLRALNSASGVSPLSYWGSDMSRVEYWAPIGGGQSRIIGSSTFSFKHAVVSATTTTINWQHLWNVQWGSTSSQTPILMSRAESGETPETYLCSDDGVLGYDGTNVSLLSGAGSGLKSCLADVSADGLRDLISFNNSNFPVRVNLQLASGGFAPSYAAQDLPAGTSDLTLHDVNRDGVLDILALQGTNLLWLRGTQLGTYEPAQFLMSVPQASQLSVQDLNLDGIEDLILYGSGLHYALGRPTAGFDSPLTLSGLGTSDVHAIDVTRDGLPDLVACHGSPYALIIYENVLSLLDCDADGIADRAQIFEDAALDLDGNGVLDSCESTGPYWWHSPLTQRLYTSLSPMTWQAANAAAVSLGGHLVTVRSENQAQSLSAFLGSSHTWCGLTDAATEGIFEWASGEPVNYTSFPEAGPGDFLPDQDYVAITLGPNIWDTWFSNTVFPGLVESDGIDCDANLLIDAAEIQQDPSLDCDSNGLLDSCELMASSAADCDGDGVLDTCQGLSPAEDVNGDNLNDSCEPPTYCAGGVNSTGQRGIMGSMGTPEIAQDSFTLTASNLPPNQWSYFIMAQTQTFIPLFSATQGNLCIGPGYIERLNQTGNQISQTIGGQRTYAFEFNALPQGVSLNPGETWHFQLWFRDQNPGQTSNTTNAISVIFR